MINKFKNQRGFTSTPKFFGVSLRSKRGFTILESIVAIIILSLSISGVFSAVQQSLSQSIIAKDEVKAFYLAQEAIEIIRNKRDNNQLYKIEYPTSNTWLYGIAENSGDDCYFGKVCQVDASAQIPPSLAYCGNDWGDCPYLKQNQDTFLYGYASGYDTNFKREVKIELVDTHEVAIIVRISWKKGLIEREFKVKTLLFNWI